MRRLPILLVLVLITFISKAEYTTVVEGYISGGVGSSIALELDAAINNRYDNVLETEVSSEGYFRFELMLDEAQPMLLSMSNVRALLFVEPNQTLTVKTSFANFLSAMTFEGVGADNNKYLKNYELNFREDYNAFNVVQYKKGGLYYKVHKSMDKKMRKLPHQEFKAIMDLEKARKKAHLDSYSANTVLSSELLKYIQDDFIYEWGYNLLVYGYAFKVMHNVPESYFTFLEEIQMQNEKVNNYKYRRFVQGYVNYLVDIQKSENPLPAQFEMVYERLNGKPRYFLQADILMRAIRAGKLNSVLPEYDIFSRENPYPELEGPLLAAFQKNVRFSEGAPAPNFELPDLENVIHSVRGYNGKVIYIDFWASWCRPCISKMSLVKQVEQELQDDDRIVFVHVSLDKDDEAWRRSIQIHNLRGVHVRAADAFESDIAKAFNVAALPQYFIIDSNGSFKSKPSSPSMRALKERLQETR